ncbi:MAG TPA: hypothetical protein VMZ31_16765 [Phycisphaerae bacterium]|nr:hypothetical protein [Phycisphaerae bacterium]
MYKHRVAFVGVWLLGAIALLLYPGFECRGLVMGLIIGYWPIYLLGALVGDAVLLTWDIIIFSMFLLSGAEVGLCAWIMDKAKIGRKVWLGLLFTIIVGGNIAFNVHADKFDSYKASPWVMAAEGSPELNYEFTLSDFYRICLIPNMIVGGLIGLYLTTAVSGLYAIGILVFRRTHPTSPMQATADSRT